MPTHIPWRDTRGRMRSKTKAAAGLVLRYLTARALFRQTPWEMPSNLEYLIGRGVRLPPGGVIINEVPLKPPAIIHHRKDPKFWSAIIGGEESAIDIDPAEQEQVRQFVLDDEWTWPVLPWEQRATGTSQSACMGHKEREGQGGGGSSRRDRHCTVGARHRERHPQVVACCWVGNETIRQKERDGWSKPPRLAM